MHDSIRSAAARPDRRFFVEEPGGGALPQSSAEDVIQRLVALLDVQSGHRVLEIGTGSGYSAALLASPVGEGGDVVSVDVDPALAARAREKHAAIGSGAVFHAGDGVLGWPADAPFDRIVAWTTPHLIPRPWTAQAAEGAVVVTPVKAAPVAVANVVVRCSIRDARPTGAALHPGSFVDMGVTTDFGLPVDYVDAARRSPTAWLSCPALRDADPGAVLGRLLTSASTTASDPLAGDRAGFLGYLYAARPPELGSASLGGGWGVGAIREDGAALVRADDVLAVGAPAAREVLESWRAAWETAGRPGLADLEIDLIADPAGWVVRPRWH